MLAPGDAAAAAAAAGNAAQQAAAAAAMSGGAGVVGGGSLLMDLEDMCPELHSLLGDMGAPEGGDIMFDARIVLPAGLGGVSGQVAGQAGSQQQLLQARPHLLIDRSSLRRLSSQASQVQNLMQQQHQMQMQQQQQQQQQQMWPSYMPYGDPIVRPSAAAAAAAAGQHHNAGMGVMGPAGLRVAAPDILTAQQYNYYSMQYSQQYGQQADGITSTAAEEAVTNSPRINANSVKARAAGSKLEAADGKVKKKPQSRQKPNNKQRLVTPNSPRLEGVTAPLEAMDGLEGLMGVAGGAGV
jgi:hypothetical protein